MQRCPTYINGIAYLPQFEHMKLQQKLYSAELLLERTVDYLDSLDGSAQLSDEIETFLEGKS